MNINNKDILIYGVGRIQKDFEYMFPNIKIKGYIVRDKKEDLGVKTFYLNELSKNVLKNTLIVVCERKNIEIQKELLNIGLKEKKDYYWVEQLGYLLDDKYDFFIENIIEFYRRCIKGWLYKKKYISNSQLFKKIIYSDSYDGPMCRKPFDYINIQDDGFVHCCCPTYSYSKIGNLGFKRLESILESNTLKLYKLAILNKTYAFCDKALCPILSSNLNKTKSRFTNINDTNYPNEISVAIDRSCNLKCKSCRKKFYNAKGIDLIFIKLFAKKILKYKNVNKVKRFVVAAQGEVFFSKVYQDMIFNSSLANRESIDIFTNGTLLNKEKLNKLCDTYKDIRLYITIDAVTKDTYNKLRIGGNFDNLMKNLEYISYMRQQGKIKEVLLFYVVQKDNYKEMIDFVKMAKKLKFDGINFSQIVNWGTFTNKEYREISMFNKNGEPKLELKKVLSNKVFKEKIVESSQIRQSFKEYDIKGLNKNKPKISVIIPLYNVEKYIGKCISSVINQTYKNLEILLINDGSTDRSLEICEKYKKKDNRIKIISQENRGVSYSRNVGLDNATGEYIAFVDSDDYIKENMIETLYSLIIKNNVDISVCDYFLVDSKQKKINPISNQEHTTELFSDDEKFELLYRNKNKGQVIGILIWNKLYKREIFENLRYPNNKIHEDESLAHIILDRADQIAYTDEKLYYYRKREGSITNQKYNLKRLEIIPALKQRYEFFKKTKRKYLASTALKDYMFFIIMHYKHSMKNNLLNSSKKYLIKEMFSILFKVILDFHITIKVKILAVIFWLMPDFTVKVLLKNRTMSI